MKKLKVGMVGGGGAESFFGPVHRRSLSLDATRELVAGALHQDPQIALAAADTFDIKGYPDYKAMAAAQSRNDSRLDYVLIVTPNNVHFEPAKMFIEQGVPVLCEKPMTFSVDEARELVRRVKEKNVPFVLSHTYTGHPMVMFAREMILNGDIGEVRKVESWYTQGWLAERLEEKGIQQAEWRVDSKRAGISGCGGDIGSHAHMAARWVTGLEVIKVSARLNSFVKGRQLDDDFNVIGELSNGGTALITATQVAIGYKNDNGFRVIGTKGTIEWYQERAERLLVRRSEVDEVYWLGANYNYFPAKIKAYLRLPAGHHEDFLEALANLHLTMEFAVRRAKGEENIPQPYPHPGVVDGLWGMAFVAAAVKSAQEDGKWTGVEV